MIRDTKKHPVMRISLLAVTTALFAAVVGMLFPGDVSAANSYVIDGDSYELGEDSDYNTASAQSKDKLCYGAKSIGKLSIHGEISEKSTYSGQTAFGATGAVSFTYSYNGSYQTDTKEDWNLESSGAKTVNGVSISKKVKNGAVIVRRSEDNREWETVYTGNDIFDSGTDVTDFYTVSLEDVKAGYYYQVMVAYSMRQKTGKKVLILNDYDSKQFLEVYEVYVCYEENPVVLYDIENGADITKKAVTTRGFIIDKGGSDYVVTLLKDQGQPKVVSNLTAVYEPGTYQIYVTTDLGKNLSYKIKVTEGLYMSSVTPKVYDGGKKGSYDETGEVTGNTSFGMRSLSSVKIALQADSRIIKKVNQVDAFGVSGSYVGLYMRLNDFSVPEANGWKIDADSWGEKEKQTVDGVWVGTVNTGALVIQKSTNGTDWETVDDGAYARGLYTTDYFKYYGKRGDVLIYTPEGNDLLNGIYLKVIYAYEASKSETKTTSRFMEVYEFYLCSSELGAVTFHNLSLEDSTGGPIGEKEGVDAFIYKKAETLVSGSGTVTGFEIDTSLNPTVTYTVTRDGVQIANPSNHRYKVTGKYEITLTSAVGNKETVTIYVDSQSPEASLKTYFGDGFISGKRIFSKGDYPVYEGGKTQFHVEPIDKSRLPISGVVQNTTTGESVQVASGQSEINEAISTPGHYIATFSTRPSSEGRDLPGDYRVFTFQFDIIAEGTAPGPVENKQNLAKYAHTSPSDAYPRYYGLTYSSAAGGNITLAFAEKETAIEYAYNYEKNTVEKQEDGTYRYTGSFLISQKGHYENAWDLTDATYFFAEQAVQDLYFDMSDQFTYRTLRKETIDQTSNLRTLELKESVTIFAEGQQEALCNHDILPFICQKPCAYLAPGLNGSVSVEKADFQFDHDKYGCDSDSVSITDCNGVEYDIEYGRGVGAQLSAAGCPSGVVTIKEQTVYGDETSYQAIYIADGDCTAQLTLAYYLNGDEQEQTFSQTDDGIGINVDAFRISDLVDQLDPYAIVKVSNSSGQGVYAVAGQASNVAWSEPGSYQVKVVNRIGNFYTIHVTVNDSGCATIAFTGPGTENTMPITTFLGEHGVPLPNPDRYGYTLIGFEDESGNHYTDEISEIMFKGDLVLRAIWEAKQYTMYFKDSQGNDLSAPVSVTFDETYTIPTPELEEGVVFMGWTNKGKPLTESEIKVETEGDITLVATFENVTPNLEEIPSVEESQDGNSAPAVFLIVIVVLLLSVGGAILWKRKSAKRVHIEVENGPEVSPEENVDPSQEPGQKDEDSGEESSHTDERGDDQL